MTEPKLILALDLSLSSTGFAIGKVVDSKVKLLEIGHINNKRYAKQTQAYRLNEIAKRLTSLYEQYPIDIVIKERGFVNGRAVATQALFKVAGVADLISFTHGHSIDTEIPPTTIKKQVTGDGKADKQKVMRAVETYLGRDVKGLSLVQFATDDESDAVALLIAFCIKEGLIEEIA